MSLSIDEKTEIFQHAGEISERGSVIRDNLTRIGDADLATRALAIANSIPHGGIVSAVGRSTELLTFVGNSRADLFDEAKDLSDTGIVAGALAIVFMYKALYLASCV